MGKKRILKSIRSFEKLIIEHNEKIVKEKSTSVPDQGLIRYWEREIMTYREELEKARGRLKRGR
ncbi:MAG: hypothetical protein IBX72_13040 [Nitrospirae bacterium]|nr:hypothetical protein [Nitrospirota bacterium]